MSIFSLKIIRLPVNPIEDVWLWLNYGELVNYTPADIPELDDALIDRLIQLKFNPELLKSL